MNPLCKKLFGQHAYSKMSGSSKGLANSEVNCPSHSQNSSTSRSAIFIVIGAFSLWTFGLILGFAFGRSHLYNGDSTGRVESFFPDTNTIPRVPLGRMQQSVHADPGFEAPPPTIEGTEPVWDSLIPRGLGYVQNTEFAPNLSVIGAFHQLHCLYLIRRAYYADTATASHNTRRSTFDVGVDRHPHVGHCFDYLRQSLQCASDSSLEPVTERVVGNPNWGFQRQCRDYEGLKRWAEKWAALDIPPSFIPAMFSGSHGAES